MVECQIFTYVHRWFREVRARFCCLLLSCTNTSVAVNATVHWASQIDPMPMRLLVKFGMICPIRACNGRWGVLITAVADKVIDCSLAILTVMGCAVPLMLYTGAGVIKKCPLAPVSAIAVKVLDEVWVGYR